MIQQHRARFEHHLFAPEFLVSDHDIEIGEAMPGIGLDHIESNMALVLAEENADQESSG